MKARTLWHRLPPPERAGTALIWSGGNCIEVYGPDYHEHGRLKIHGVLDQRQRVYQSGGEFKNFHFRAKNAITLPLEVWDFVREDCEWIEMIDHELNHCYRIKTRTAEDIGTQYQWPIGGHKYQRFAIPLGAWHRSEGAIEPERPVPTSQPTVAATSQIGLPFL